MAKRVWRAGPDEVYGFYGEDGEIVQIPYVSRERLLEAVLDGVSFLDRSGGSLVVTVGRQPTEVPGEALTTGVAVQWQDGPRAKAQPEAPVVLPTPQTQTALGSRPPASGPEEDPEPFEADEEPQDGLEEARAAHDGIGDGLDESLLPEEDLSEIPPSMR